MDVYEILRIICNILMYVIIGAVIFILCALVIKVIIWSYKEGRKPILPDSSKIRSDAIYEKVLLQIRDNKYYWPNIKYYYYRRIFDEYVSSKSDAEDFEVFQQREEDWLSDCIDNVPELRVELRYLKNMLRDKDFFMKYFDRDYFSIQDMTDTIYDWRHKNKQNFRYSLFRVKNGKIINDIESIVKQFLQAHSKGAEACIVYRVLYDRKLIRNDIPLFTNWLNTISTYNFSPEAISKEYNRVQNSSVSRGRHKDELYKEFDITLEENVLKRNEMRS